MGVHNTLKNVTFFYSNGTSLIHTNYHCIHGLKIVKSGDTINKHTDYMKNAHIYKFLNLSFYLCLILLLSASRCKGLHHVVVKMSCSLLSAL